MNEQNNTHKKGSWGIRSVYLAIGVSLAAVAVASWITFASISSTLSGGTDPTEANVVEPVDETVSGITEEIVSEEAEIVSEPAEEADVTPDTVTPPLQNGIAKSFSGEELVYSETLRDWRVHNGTDFLAEEGEDVCAIAGGTVTKVYDDGLMGYVVVIESGTIEAYYCGLDSEIPVQEGDPIAAGQVIGTVGILPAEQAEGTHLHLEVKRDGAYVDAETLMEAAS